METITDTINAFFTENALIAALKIIGAVLILIIGFKLINLLVKYFEKSKGYAKLDPTIQSFSVSLISISLKIIVVISFAGILGVPMTSIIAVLGSAGLALGLALQGGLANIAGSFIILVFKPFKVGDFVTADSYAGTVSEIGIFYSVLITLENKTVHIPNGTLANTSVTNFTALETRRVDLVFGVSYKSDIDKVRETLVASAAGCGIVLRDPAPTALVSGHKDSSVEFTLRYWCKSSDYSSTYYYLIEQVKRDFDKNGIEIPYPQLDVHMDENK